MAIVVGGVAIDLSAESVTYVREMEKAARATLGATRKMQSSLTRFQGGFSRVEARFSRFSRTLTRGFASLGRLALPGLGVGLIGGGLVLAAKQAITSADAIAKAADRAGLATDAYQALEFQASQTGVAQEKLNVSLQAFGRRLAEAQAGGGPLVSTLARLNPELLQTLQQTRGVSAGLRVVADAMARAETQSDRLAISQAAFGEAGRALTLTFKEGAAGIDRYAAQARRFGLIIDEQLLRGAEGANDALDLLQRTIGARLTSAMLAAAPAIQSLATAFAEMIPVAAEAAVSLGKFFGVVAEGKVDQLRTDLAEVEAGMDSVAASIARMRATGGDHFSDVLEIDTAVLAKLAERRQAIIDSIQLAESKAKFPGLSVAADDARGLADALGDAAASADKLAGARLPLPSPSPAFGPPRPSAADLERARGASFRAPFGGNAPLPPPGGKDAAITEANLEAQREKLNAITAATEEVTSGMGRMVTGFALGENTIQQFFSTLLRNLADTAAQALITQAALALVKNVFGGGTAAASTTGGGGGVQVQPRAGGGPVLAGAPYLVGEHGRELFIPSRGGQIISNAQLRRGAGGGGFTIIDQRGRGAPPIETSIDARGMAIAFVRSEIGNMAGDGTLSRLTGTHRRGIQRG
jgi:hypothetical protein